MLERIARPAIRTCDTTEVNEITVKARMMRVTLVISERTGRLRPLLGERYDPRHRSRYPHLSANLIE